MSDTDPLHEQIDYYRARAPEYDEWHQREGRYDHGEQHARQWFDELSVVRNVIDSAAPLGRCLELACGTGQWTPQLARRADRVTAVDASPETIDINRSRQPEAQVDYVVADLFDWTPDGTWDTVFFGFWLSHIPLDRLDRFWEMIEGCIVPGGRMLFVDGLPAQATTAKNHAPIDASGISERKLNDGRVYHIVKVFHEPATLQQQLAERGWMGRVEATGDFFYYGDVQRSTTDMERTVR